MEERDKMSDYFAIRVNQQLKEDFYSCCKRKGFTAGMAVKLFARQFSEKGIIPFSLDANKSYPDDKLTRISIHMDAKTRQNFAAACEEQGLSMSFIVRAYMDYCVTNDCFPLQKQGE